MYRIVTKYFDYSIVSNCFEFKISLLKLALVKLKGTRRGFAHGCDSKAKIKGNFLH